MLALRYFEGTLELVGARDDAKRAQRMCEAFVWDERTGVFRAPAMAYADALRAWKAGGIDIRDDARAYETLEIRAGYGHTSRPYQRDAIAAWLRQKGRGTIVLPTGSGKTHVATRCIAEKKRSTIVVCPTLDLVRQWHGALEKAFAMPVGLIGGGEHDPRAITVTTYDSAYLHMARLGNRYGLIVFDECHHLPAEGYAFAAKAALAPFRLGLTATPEREDGREAALSELVGPIAYRRDIPELSGDYLADYDVETITVELSRDERAVYEAERKIYRAYIAKSGIRLGGPRGFGEFIRRAAVSREGRRALDAFRKQRALAFSASQKIDKLGELLHRHRRDRAIVFTQDNAIAYRIASRFLIPIITHHTRVRERSEILDGLANHTYSAVVTSKVLNEGVDVPSANVAIVVSGSGSVREHVQRLGRILRKHGDKRALLYEIVTSRTTETMTSSRRRDHDAYA